MADPDLMQLLAGRLLPEQYLGAGQADDPLSNYLQSFNYDPMPEALANAEATGVYAQKPQYISDDLWNRIKFYADRQQDQAKAALSAQQDERDYGLKERQFGLSQGKDLREQEAFAGKYSTADQDAAALAIQGITEDHIRQAFDNNDAEALNQIAVALNMTDPEDPTKTSWTADINNQRRMVELEQFHDNQRAQQAQGADAQLVSEVQQRRWANLDPQMRAKETFLKMTKDPTAVVNRQGQVFTGADAEKQAAPAWFNQSTQVPRYTPSPRAAAPGKPRSGGTDVSDASASDLAYLGRQSQALGQGIVNTGRGAFNAFIGHPLSFAFGNKHVPNTAVDKWIINTAKGALTDRGEKKQAATKTTTKKK